MSCRELNRVESSTILRASRRNCDAAANAFREASFFLAIPVLAFSLEPGACSNTRGPVMLERDLAICYRQHFCWTLCNETASNQSPKYGIIPYCSQDACHQGPASLERQLRLADRLSQVL